MKFLDLRSDTVTTPTSEMRSAMMTAPVGDDVYDDDPTTIKLQKEAAKITGFESALFVPSGTMGNQLAILTHTKRGDEVILGYNSHIAAHEVGGASVLAGVSYRIVKNNDDTISGQDIENAVRISDIHCPDTGLVCLENALGNGRVVALEKMKDAFDAAGKYGLPVHLDGARLFNAALYLGVEPVEVTRYSDSVMFCLSKGLCAPVGSVLCGSESFIRRAKKYRKLLGGGMRQTGILAACGLIALKKMVHRLGTDHENAAFLAKKLNELPGVSVDTEGVHINIVYFKFNSPDFKHDGFVHYMHGSGVKINPQDNGMYRFVTHNDLSREDIEVAVEIMRGYL